MGGKLKTFLVGPRELSRLPVTLIECSGVMSMRLCGSKVDSVLSAADDGGLTFAGKAGRSRYEFTGRGLALIAPEPAVPDVVVVAPREFAELGVWVGWLGKRRTDLASCLEIVLPPTGSDNRAIFRVRGRYGGSYSDGRVEMVTELIRFIRTLDRRRGRVGLTPLAFRGIVNEGSWFDR